MWLSFINYMQRTISKSLNFVFFVVNLIGLSIRLPSCRTTSITLSKFLRCSSFNVFFLIAHFNNLLLWIFFHFKHRMVFDWQISVLCVHLQISIGSKRNVDIYYKGLCGAPWILKARILYLKLLKMDHYTDVLEKSAIYFELFQTFHT